MKSISSKRRLGFAQVPIILGLALAAVTLPLLNKLVSQNQENRSKAAECPCNGCPAEQPNGPDAYCGCVDNNGQNYKNVGRQNCSSTDGNSGGGNGGGGSSCNRSSCGACQIADGSLSFDRNSQLCYRCAGNNSGNGTFNVVDRTLCGAGSSNTYVNQTDGKTGQVVATAAPTPKVAVVAPVIVISTPRPTLQPIACPGDTTSSCRCGKDMKPTRLSAGPFCIDDSSTAYNVNVTIPTTTPIAFKNCNGLDANRTRCVNDQVQLCNGLNGNIEVLYSCSQGCDGSGCKSAPSPFVNLTPYPEGNRPTAIIPPSMGYDTEKFCKVRRFGGCESNNYATCVEVIINREPGRGCPGDSLCGIGDSIMCRSAYSTNAQAPTAALNTPTPDPRIASCISARGSVYASSCASNDLANAGNGDMPYGRYCCKEPTDICKLPSDGSFTSGYCCFGFEKKSMSGGEYVCQVQRAPASVPDVGNCSNCNPGSILYSYSVGDCRPDMEKFATCSVPGSSTQNSCCRFKPLPTQAASVDMRSYFDCIRTDTPLACMAAVVRRMPAAAAQTAQTIFNICAVGSPLPQQKVACLLAAREAGVASDVLNGALSAVCGDGPGALQCYAEWFGKSVIPQLPENPEQVAEVIFNTCAVANPLPQMKIACLLAASRNGAPVEALSQVVLNICKNDPNVGRCVGTYLTSSVIGAARTSQTLFNACAVVNPLMPAKIACLVAAREAGVAADVVSGAAQKACESASDNNNCMAEWFLRSAFPQPPANASEGVQMILNTCGVVSLAPTLKAACLLGAQNAGYGIETISQSISRICPSSDPSGSCVGNIVSRLGVSAAQSAQVLFNSCAVLNPLLPNKIACLIAAREAGVVVNIANGAAAEFCKNAVNSDLCFRDWILKSVVPSLPQNPSEAAQVLLNTCGVIDPLLPHKAICLAAARVIGEERRLPVISVTPIPENVIPTLAPFPTDILPICGSFDNKASCVSESYGCAPSDVVSSQRCRDVDKVCCRSRILAPSDTGSTANTGVITGVPPAPSRPTSSPASSGSSSTPSSGGSGSGSSSAPADSCRRIAVRVQPNTTTPLTTNLGVKIGENVLIRCVKEGVAQVESNTKIVIDGGSLGKTERTGGAATWVPDKVGTFTITCSDLSCNNRISIDSATVRVVAASAPSACKACSNDFRCYGNPTYGYAWFVPGYEQNGYSLSVDAYCNQAGKIKPTWKGKAMGDANCDGVIGVQDTSIWRKEYSISRLQSTTSSTWDADFNCDGRVDTTDYNTWKTNYVNIRRGL